jgi:hypothetical protein
MAAGRRDIRREQDRLNASFNTPIVDKEMSVLERGAWIAEVIAFSELIFPHLLNKISFPNVTKNFFTKY